MDQRVYTERVLEDLLPGEDAREQGVRLSKNNGPIRVKPLLR